MFRKSIALNILFSFFSQLSGIITALIIPILIIRTYGSEVNGVIISTQQIVNYFAILESGVAAAAGVFLYKALQNQEVFKINSVFAAVNTFYRKTGIYLALIIVLFSLLYPLNSTDSSSYLQNVIIIILISSTTLLGYLIFFKYNLILYSDQKQYITQFSISLSLIAITTIQFFLIKKGYSILFVISVIPIINLLRLLIIKRIVMKKYAYLDKKVEADLDSLSHKWDALAINISRLIKNLVPLLFVTIFLGFEFASVLSIYVIVFRIGSSILEMIGNGLTSTLARTLKDDMKNGEEIYFKISTLIFGISCIIGVASFILFPSFITLYIGEGADINYYYPILVISFVINEAINNIRFTSNIFIRAKGIFKETRNSSLIELILAVVFTPVGYIFLGFEGVLLGSIIASTYRTMYLEIYITNKLLNLGILRFLLNFLKYLLIFLVLAFLFMNYNFNSHTYLLWIIKSVLLVITALIIIYSLEFFKKIFSKATKI